MAYSINIGNVSESPFMNKFGVFQDGTVPMYRDTDGKLWAISGHSHMGHIGMFCGTSLEDMKEVYPLSYNFCTGNAEYAFDGIRYPEGVKPRGSIWPFGLYICPKTHRFFAFIHNETGWCGKGTAYDAFGLCETPAFDSDFRHVGLMHSDDEGRTWTFDRWVLTAEDVCFTEKFNPGAGNAVGQKSGLISLGSGDFSLFPNPNDDYIYIFYNIIHVDTEERGWKGCDTYVARTRKRSDGIMGDFVKYYDGSFCEPGNFGKETPIATNTWHSRAVYSDKFGKYFLSATFMRPDGDNFVTVSDRMCIRISDNLTEWSEPFYIKDFGNHYVAMISEEGKGNPYVISDSRFTLLSCHNGTDVMKYEGEITEK